MQERTITSYTLTDSEIREVLSNHISSKYEIAVKPDELKFDVVLGDDLEESTCEVKFEAVCDNKMTKARE